LSGEEVMTEEGFRLRVLNVASVSKAEEAQSVQAQASGTSAPAGTSAASRITEFSAAGVVVIESTIAMEPYIERTREAVRKVYEQIEAENLGKQVKFGLVAYRSSVKAVPGLEYTSRMYADPTTVTDGADFLKK